MPDEETKVTASPQTETTPPVETEEPARELSYFEQLVAKAAEAKPGSLIEDDPDQLYRVGVWKGMPNFCCRVEGCGFAVLGGRDATLGPQRILDHYEARHHEAVAPKPPSELVGPNGRPL